MDVLPEAFAVTSVSGLWFPTYLKSELSRWLYRVYTSIIVTLILLLLMSQLIALFFLTSSVDEMVGATYLMITTIGGWVKGFNLLMKRQKLINLASMFTDSKCMPKNDDEWTTCLYFDNMARFIALSLTSLAGVSSSINGMRPLLTSSEGYALSVKSWQPYEISSSLIYSITLFHQILSLMCVALWCVSSDVLCAGFMIRICSQLHLLSHRLKVVCEANDDALHQYQLVRQSVQHHLHIFEITKQVESLFAPCILAQYLQSSTVICVTIYQLVTNRSDIIETLVTFIFLTAMLTELLVYCWFGNEIFVQSLKFTEMVCQANWTELHNSSLKGLLIMMLRSSSPIKITCGPLITLSNDTYVSILKLSYSVFNVLQRSH